MTTYPSNEMWVITHENPSSFQHFLFAMESDVPRMTITFAEDDLSSIDNQCQSAYLFDTDMKYEYCINNVNLTCRDEQVKRRKRNKQTNDEWMKRLNMRCWKPE